MGRFSFLLVAALWLSAVPAASPLADPDSPLGLWLVQDKSAVMEFHPCGSNALCGRLYWDSEPLNPDGTPKRDVHNPDAALRGTLLCGLDLLTGFVPDGPNEWDEGRAYDPGSGKVYHAEMQIADDGALHLRGYVGIPLFGETRTWTRAKADTAPSCKMP